MPQKTSTKGFTVVETVIVILVVAVLAFGGWFIWRKEHTKGNTSTKNQASQNNKRDQNLSNPPAPAPQYIEVKEWKVRVALPESLQGDITYQMDDTAAKLSGGPVLASFLSKKFSADSLKCQELDNGTPRVLISINKEVDGDGSETTSEQPFKRIGDARFYFVATACEEMINKKGSTQDKKLLSDIKEALTSGLESY